MMRTLFRLIRWLVIVAVVVVVLVVGGVALLISEFGMRRVILPTVNARSDVKIEMTGWRFRPWSSLRIEGMELRAHDATHGTTVTLAEIGVLDVEYDVNSLFGAHPVIKRIIVDKPVIDLSSSPVTVSEPVAGEEVIIVEEPEPGEPARVGGLPFTVEMLEIRDGRIIAADPHGAATEIQGLTLQVENLGPERTCTIAADALVAYSDGKQTEIESLTFALREEAVFGAAMLPESVKLSVRVSDVKGTSGAADLSSLGCAVDVTVDDVGDDTVELSACEATVEWSGRTLATLSVTGALSAARQEAALVLSTDIGAGELWQGLAGVDSPLNVENTSLKARMVLDIGADNSSVDCRGDLTVKQIGLRVPAGPPPPPLDVTAAFTLALDNEAETLNVPRLEMSAVQGTHPVLQLRNEAPLQLAFGDDTEGIVAPPTASVSVVVNAFPLEQLNGVLVSNDLEILAGTLSAGYNCDIIRLGEEIRLRGTTSADNLTLRQGSSRWSSLAYAETVDMNIREFRFISIDQLLGQFTLGGVPAGEVALGGYIDLETLSNRVAFAVADLRSELVRPMLDPTFENPRLENLVLTVQALTRSDDPMRYPQDISARATVVNAGRPRPDEWDRLTWELNAGITPEVVTLKQCTLGLQPGQWEDNQLALTGSAYLQPTNAMSSLLLASEHFDATVLLDTLAPREGKAVQAPTPTMPKDTAPGQEPAPAPLAGRNIDFKVRIEDLLLREVRVQPLLADITLADSVLTLSTAGTRVNGGTLALQTRNDLGVTGYHYNVSLSSRGIPLAPIVNTFAPSMKGDITGMLSGTADIRGRGLTKPNLKHYLAGSSRFDVENGHLFNVPLLDDLGRMLGNESIRRFSYSNAVAQLDVSRGIVAIRELEMSGKTMNMGVKGTVTLDEELDLAMHLGFSGQQMASMLSKLYPGMALGGKMKAFYDIPIPIRVTGTIGEPEIMTSLTDLAPAMAGAMGFDPVKQLGDLIDEIPMDDQVKEGVNTLKDLFFDQLNQGGRDRR